jgi:hypothetical protein
VVGLVYGELQAKEDSKKLESCSSTQSLRVLNRSRTSSFPVSPASLLSILLSEYSILTNHMLIVPFVG